MQIDVAEGSRLDRGNLRVSPNDPALPVLDALLPPSGDLTLITGWLHKVAGYTSDPAAASVAYVRYQPGESCVLCWSLRFSTGEREIVTAWAFADSRRAEQAIGSARAGRAFEIADSFGAPRNQHFEYLPEHALVLQRFPLDIGLATLPASWSAGWLQQRFAPLLDESVAELQTWLAHYKPMRRAIFRYDARTDSEPRSYFGKFYRGKRGAQLLDINASISKHLAAAAAPWLVPAPREYLEHPRTLIFDAAPNAHRLYPVLSNAHEHRDQVIDIAARAIAGLAPFRSAPVSGVAPRTPADEIASLRRLLQSLPQNDTTASIAAMIDRLESFAASLPPEPVVLTHGRFRVEQFMASSTDLFLIDLDTVCTSVASADPGSLLAYLDLARLRFPRGASVIEECARSVEQLALDHKLASANWLAWNRAKVLAEKALRAYLSLHPTPQATALALLELARRSTPR